MTYNVCIIEQMISLSVATSNRSQRLYERQGYVVKIRRHCVAVDTGALLGKK
jgi:ribosomal protein S18 acetylase RimI-like enzyme